MNLEDRNEGNQAMQGFRGAMDLFMGALYVGVSVYAAQNPALTDQFGMSVYVFSGLFGLYGLFRLYRGISSFKGSLKQRKK